MFSQKVPWVHLFSVSCFVFLEKVKQDLIRIVTDLLKALLGSSLVGTFQHTHHQQYCGSVFFVAANGPLLYNACSVTSQQCVGIT
jgi:hypothetical protein